MVRQCSGVSRLNLAALGGYAGLDTPSAAAVSCIYLGQCPAAVLDQFQTGFDTL